MKPITVFLTACGSAFAPGIIKCLKKNGEREIRIIGGDMVNDPSSQYLVDRFYPIPSALYAHYAEEILGICSKEKVDILLPQMSAELPVYLKNLHQFEQIGTMVSMTRNLNINIANNKCRLFEFMKEHEIETPEFFTVHTFDEFQHGLFALGYPYKPVVVKLPESSGARGVRVIDESKSKYALFACEKPTSVYVSYEDMKAILLDAEKILGKGVFPELMLMEYLPGDEYDIDLLAEDGKVLYTAGRRNPEMLMSIAQTSVLERNERAEKIAAQLVETLKLDGNLGFDFKFDGEGKVQLLEINPRIDATISIFAAGGLNLPYLRIKQLLGEELPEVKVSYGTHLKRCYMEIFTDEQENLIAW